MRALFVLAYCRPFDPKTSELRALFVESGGTLALEDHRAHRQVQRQLLTQAIQLVLQLQSLLLQSPGLLRPIAPAQTK